MISLCDQVNIFTITSIYGNRLKRLLILKIYKESGRGYVDLQVFWDENWMTPGAVKAIMIKRFGEAYEKWGSWQIPVWCFLCLPDGDVAQYC
jgi:hypothetical protein